MDKTLPSDSNGPQVTFFIPCLNEEDNVVPTLETIASAAQKTGISYEALIVDDHSTDNTVSRVRDFKARHPEMPVILKVNSRTLGLGYNYVEGSFLGKGKYYILVNGDNAEPESALVSILSRTGKADMIIPFFGDMDARGKGRRTVSAFFTWMVNCASGARIKYFNGPVLHLRYNVMRWHPDTQGFAYQAEIITRLLEQGATYEEVQVANIDRKGGISKAFSLKNFLSVSHSLLQILLRRVRRLIFH